MYKRLLRPLFFLLDPEKIHHLSFSLIRLVNKIPLVFKFFQKNCIVQHPSLEKEVFGLKFKNPIGLAAGFDKDGKIFEELGHFGFGHIEVGTVTPRPQTGNPKKRLFRLPKDKALINRMGFNNNGVDALVEKLKKRKSSNLIIGGNIGKNKDTPNERAVDDYLFCFQKLFDFVDYFVVNVSSPNTPNLRELQEKKPLLKILNILQNKNSKQEKRKPILLKIAPDLTDTQLDDIIEIVQESKIDGVIATNTTISRQGLKTDIQITNEKGGLSGKPVQTRSTEVVKYLSEKSKKSFPIIAVGGIFTAKDVNEKLAAGADLVQVYTGFIYEGPGMIKRICKKLAAD